ncbi:MAG: twin-arginine translocation signal domain-containing protein, partial [Bacteroidetes bacterium]|nr:twin-arginine translocation signal domain-containing protein [Bacteroidota bacterium]
MQKEEMSNSRREFLKKLPVLAVGAAALGGCSSEEIEEFFQQNFKTLSKEEKDEIVKNLEKKYSEKYGKEFTVTDT